MYGKLDGLWILGNSQSWKNVCFSHLYFNRIIFLFFFAFDMVTKLYKLKKTGIFDYVLVRITAVIQAVYFSVITFYWLVNRDFKYEQLSGFFDILLVEIFTIIVAFSIAYHSVQGIWNVATDYLTQAQIGASAKILRPAVIGFSWLQALGLIICSFYILG